MDMKNALTAKLGNEVDILHRHVSMLRSVREHGPIGIIRLSEMLDLPQHKVRYSLRILEQADLIRPSPEGAIVTDSYDAFMLDLRDFLDSLEGELSEMRRSLG